MHTEIETIYFNSIARRQMRDAIATNKNTEFVILKKIVLKYLKRNGLSSNGSEWTVTINIIQKVTTRLEAFTNNYCSTAY